MNDAILDWKIAAVLLALFSILWIFLGWRLGRKNRDLDDYMLAGRKVGLALAMATVMATWVTSNTTMVAPQLAYQMGVWGMLGYSLGSIGLFLFAPMSARIRRLMPSGYTSGDFIRLRYGKFAWRVFLIISFVYAGGWLVSLGMAGGKLIQALSGIDYWIGSTVILGICVLYTILGGLRAVIGTDFIQTLIIICGIVFLGFLVTRELTFSQIHADISRERPELLNLLMPAALMFLFNNLLFGIGEIFHSNVWWSRALAFKEGIGFRAYLLAGIFWTPIPVAAGFLAFCGPSLGLNVPKPDMVGPLIAAKILGVGGAVIVFIVIFSALASSVDSVLAALSDLITEDVYRKHMRPNASKTEIQKAAVYTTLILGILTWSVCILNLSDLASVLHFTGALVASTIWPIAAGLYWRRTNAFAATAGMLLGSATGLIAYFAIGFYVASLIGAAVSMCVVIVFSYLGNENFDFRKLAEKDF